MTVARKIRNSYIHTIFCQVIFGFFAQLYDNFQLNTFLEHFTWNSNTFLGIKRERKKITFYTFMIVVRKIRNSLYIMCRSVFNDYGVGGSNSNLGMYTNCK